LIAHGRLSWLTSIFDCMLNTQYRIVSCCSAENAVICHEKLRAYSVVDAVSLILHCVPK